MIDHSELLSLLLLKKELLGYPGAHPALNYMVDSAITDAETAAKPEMADAIEAKKAAQQKSHIDQATLDQENAVLAAAAMAKARVDQVGLDQQQVEADKKTLAQADAIMKAREARSQSNSGPIPLATGPKAIPAAHFPPGHHSNG
jgi:hypothetical protein